MTLIEAQFILGTVAFHAEAYELNSWHVVALYQVLNVLVALYDVFILQRAPWTHNIARQYYYDDQPSF